MRTATRWTPAFKRILLCSMYHSNLGVTVYTEPLPTTMIMIGSEIGKVTGSVTHLTMKVPLKNNSLFCAHTRRSGPQQLNPYISMYVFLLPSQLVLPEQSHFFPFRHTRTDNLPPVRLLISSSTWQHLKYWTMITYLCMRVCEHPSFNYSSKNLVSHKICLFHHSDHSPRQNAALM